MKRALAYDLDNCLAQELISVSSDELQVSNMPSAEQLCASVENEPADLVMLHISLIDQFNVLSKLRRLQPDIPAMVLTREKPSEQFWQELLSRSPVELVQIPCSPNELRFRIHSLLERHTPIQKPSDILVSPVAELRNDQSGKLDANLISDIFGLSIAEVARCINREAAGVRKTPDAVSLQQGLHQFERIASALFRLTEGIKGLKMWLNAPNPRFKGEPPIIFLKKGEVKFLADIVDDALLGHPA